MLCFLCGKEIGWLRATVDRQYCSAKHRAEARLASATVFREEDDEEIWSVSKSKQKHQGRPSPSNQTASIFAFLTLSALLIALVMLPMGNSAPAGARYTPLSLDTAKRGLIARSEDAVGEVLRSAVPVTLHHDFQSGLQEWREVAVRAASKVDDPHDWKTPSSPVVPAGSLRLWTRSTLLKNYQLEFQGEIERKSLAWAFRASDSDNYYAAKIQITRPGPLPNADLVRYVMLDGRTVDRVQLPLPLTLERGGNYRVRVNVQEDRFVTYLNGQVISAWTDKRLKRGGVGFFADDDDQQRIAWVNVSEHDSFIGQMLAHFSLFIVPGTPLP